MTSSLVSRWKYIASNLYRIPLWRAQHSGNKHSQASIIHTAFYFKLGRSKNRTKMRFNSKGKCVRTVNSEQSLQEPTIHHFVCDLCEHFERSSNTWPKKMSRKMYASRYARETCFHSFDFATAFHYSSTFVAADISYSNNYSIELLQTKSLFKFK